MNSGDNFSQNAFQFLRCAF